MGGVENREEDDMANGPAHKIRIGTIQVTIWRNLAERGNWYSVKLTRGYRVDEGFRETDNMGFEDLLTAAKLLDMAHTWIKHQLDADSKGRRQADSVTAK